MSIESRGTTSVVGVQHQRVHLNEHQDHPRHLDGLSRIVKECMSHPWAASVSYIGGMILASASAGYAVIDESGVYSSMMLVSSWAAFWFGEYNRMKRIHKLE